MKKFINPDTMLMVRGEKITNDNLTEAHYNNLVAMNPEHAKLFKDDGVDPEEQKQLAIPKSKRHGTKIEKGTEEA